MYGIGTSLLGSSILGSLLGGSQQQAAERERSRNSQRPLAETYQGLGQSYHGARPRESAPPTAAQPKEPNWWQRQMLRLQKLTPEERQRLQGYISQAKRFTDDYTSRNLSSTYY